MIIFWLVPISAWREIQVKGASFYFGASGYTTIQEANRKVVEESGGERIVGLE